MTITIHSKAFRLASAVVEICIFLLLVAMTFRISVAAWLARTPTIQSVGSAIRLDPFDSKYYVEIGRIHEYSPTDADPGLATAELTRATKLDPYNPEAWLEMGAAFEFAGKVREAENCLRQADELAPYLPPYQWPIGNFFLLHGNLQEAFQHLKIVLAGTDRYNQILFDTAWKASGNPDQILNELVPNEVSVELAYLSYVSGHHLQAAPEVWNRILNSGKKFPPIGANDYINSLVSAKQPDQAYSVWSDLVAKGLLPATYAASRDNLICNGDFEQPPLGFGFDWRIIPLEGVFAGLDETTFHSPGHSLLIEFHGTSNVDYHNVFEWVKVSPGRSYHLQAFIKASGITTDSGPRLEVRDVYDPSSLDVLSDSITGDTMGWTAAHLDFTARPKTSLISVGIARTPSQKFDNLIKGKVWIDDVSLSPLN